jgi:hypothetical protein
MAEAYDDPTQEELDQMFAGPDVAMSKGEVVPMQRLPSGHAIASGNAMLVRDKIVLSQKVGLPRSDADILNRLRMIAAYAGDEVLLYRWPVKNRRTGKTDTVEGLTIKAAMALLVAYGNADTDILEAERGDSWIFKTYFNDYERGVSFARLFKQYKGVVRGMGRDDDQQAAWRREDMGYQLGQSKAIRNVILNYLELPYGKFLEDEAKKNLVAKVGKNIEVFRERCRLRLAELGVEVTRVERQVGRAIADWLAPDIARVITEIKAVQDGMASPADQWPLPPPPEPRRSDAPTPDAPSSESAGSDPSGPAEAAAPSGSPHTTQAAHNPAATGSEPPPASSQEEKNWRVPDSVVGQDGVLGALEQLLDMTESDAEQDEFERQNADRIARITGLRRNAFDRKRSDKRLSRVASPGS